jgi:WhiB family redox-sensing transcriptional regulator
MTVDTNFWRSKAACRTRDPEIWFTPARVKEAKEICQDCPVLEQCRQVAVRCRDKWGVRAGLDLSVQAERRKLHRLPGQDSPVDRDVSAAKPCGKCGRKFDTQTQMRWCAPCRGLVPAGPVRAHVRLLMAAGMTTREIATAAGMARESLRPLLHTKHGEHVVKFTKGERAERILAVPVPLVVAS